MKARTFWLWWRAQHVLKGFYSDFSWCNWAPTTLFSPCHAQAKVFHHNGNYSQVNFHKFLLCVPFQSTWSQLYLTVKGKNEKRLFYCFITFWLKRVWKYFALPLQILRAVLQRTRREMLYWKLRCFKSFAWQRQLKWNKNNNTAFE